MTALAALIQHLENPMVVKVGQTVVYDSWEYFADRMDWYTFSGQTPWYTKVVQSVQSQQLADGINVETVGESLGLS